MGFDIGNIASTALGAASSVAQFKAGNIPEAINTAANTYAGSNLNLPGSREVGHLTERFQGIQSTARDFAGAASLLRQPEHQLVKTA
jgi:hypothetical protein